MTTVNAAASGTFPIGGDLTVNRLGLARCASPARASGVSRRTSKPRRKCCAAPWNSASTSSTRPMPTVQTVSERLIGEALAPYANGVVVATKGGPDATRPKQMGASGTPRIFAAGSGDEPAPSQGGADRSLATAPHRSAGSGRGFARRDRKLQAEGKIRHVGLSEVKPHEIERARKRWTSSACRISTTSATASTTTSLDYCEQHAIAFIPWFPVAAGKLAQPGGKLDAAAKKHGATVGQLSLAWLLHRSPVNLLDGGDWCFHFVFVDCVTASRCPAGLEQKKRQGN